MLHLFAYLTCALLLLVYYFLTKNYSYWESRKIPCDKPFLFFGSFYEIVTGKQNFGQRVTEIYNKFQTPYIGIYIFNMPTLIVKSPELIKTILVKDFNNFCDRKVKINEKCDPISSHAMFNVKNPVWKELRIKISPVFSLGKLKLMLPLLKDCGNDFNDYLAKYQNQTIDMEAIAYKFTIDIISSCAFGIDAKSLKGQHPEIEIMARKLLDFTSFTRSFSVMCFFFMPKLVDIFRLTLADRKASDFLLNLFNTTYKERQKMQIERHDLIDLLNSLKKSERSDDEYKFNDQNMASQAVSFFSAGQETTASAIAFALYELALQKDIQDRLRDEIRSTLKKDKELSYKSIQEMKYLDMVLNETLRKYPVAFILNRQVAEDYTIKETGVTLEKDLFVIIPVMAIHYDPEFYPEPERFNPERFSDENKNNINPYTFLPFGDGPRNCIGSRLGILAFKVALISALKDFALEVVEETQIPIRINPAAVFMRTLGRLDLKVVKA